MKNTLFINLFGGPGSGKSTLCAAIFTELKIKGIDCEMALEYAKDVVWEESYSKLKNQIYIFGKQHSRLHRLKGKVDVVITDSPLINSIIYDISSNKYLKDLAIHEYEKLNTINYLIKRSTVYNPNGRMQTVEGAVAVDEKCKNLLEEYNIPYKIIDIGVNNAPMIAEEIISILGK